MAAMSEQDPARCKFRNDDNMSKLQELIVDYRQMCSEQSCSILKVVKKKVVRLGWAALHSH